MTKRFRDLRTVFCKRRRLQRPTSQPPPHRSTPPASLCADVVAPAAAAPLMAANNMDSEEQSASSGDEADEPHAEMRKRTASAGSRRRRARVPAKATDARQAPAAASPSRPNTAELSRPETQAQAPESHAPESPGPQSQAPESQAPEPVPRTKPKKAQSRYRTGLRWLEDGGAYPILDPAVDHLKPGVTHLHILNTRFKDKEPISIEHVRRLAASRHECSLWSEQEVEAFLAYISPEPPRFLLQSELRGLLPGERPEPPVLTPLYRSDMMKKLAAQERQVREDIRTLFQADLPDAAAAKEPPAAASSSAAGAGCASGEPAGDASAKVSQGAAKRRRRAAPKEPLFVRTDAAPAGTPLRDKCARLEELRAFATARAPKGDPFSGTRLRRPRWERLVEGYQHLINPNFRPGEDKLIFKMTPDVLTRCWEQAEADIKAAQEAYERDPRAIDSRLSEADLLLFELDPSARGEWEREQEAWYDSKKPKVQTPAWDFQEYWARCQAQSEACKKRMAKTPAEIAHARDFPPPPIRPLPAAVVFVPPPPPEHVRPLLSVPSAAAAAAPSTQ